MINGHPLLIQSALDAVKQWKYKPTLLNGEPVEVVTKLQSTSISAADEVPLEMPSAESQGIQKI